MGNTASSSSPGTLSIVLDPPPSRNGAYIAGQPISGSVYVQSETNVSSQVISADAYISGKERSRVRYTERQGYTDSSGKRKSRSVTRYRHAERQIIHMAINLGNVSTGVEAGARYRFPFQIQLPSDLPSSMYISENNAGRHGGGHGEISYKIKAELKGNRWFGNHKVEQAINVISEPLPMQPVPNLVPPIVKDINYFCCIHVGTITMGARVANTRIGRGETAIIDFACKNQSLRGIKQAEVTVKEEARWTAGGKHNYNSRVIAHQTFRETERWEKMSKEEMKELKARSRSQTDSYRDHCHGMLEVIHAAIHDGEHRALVNIAPSSLQSYNGALIQVSHCLKIKVFTSGSCTDNPTIKIPMYVGTPSSLLLQPEQPHSTVAEQPPTVTAIAMPSAPPLQPMPTPAPSAPPDEWVNAVTATPVVVGQSTAVVGGTAIWEAEGDGTEPYNPQEEYIAMAVAEVVPSLPNLLKEIEYSVSPLSTVRKRIDEDEWKHRVFNVLTPSGYASVVKAVAIEFDQPDMAALIAPEVSNYTHEYIIAALRVVSDWLRTPLLSKVLPLCSDLSENANKIKAELTDWELVCTQQDFEEATGGR